MSIGAFTIMIEYECKKHGILEKSELIRWADEPSPRWCRHCMGQMMNDYCGYLIAIEVDDDQSKKGEFKCCL